MSGTITVKGVGTASTKPDYIIISLNITSKASEYANTIDNANSRIGMLQNAIGTVGFAKEELKTLSFDVRTDYKNVDEPDGQRGIFQKSVASGYICVYRLKLSFDLDNKRLVQTLEAISQSGADAELSIAFTVKNPENIKAELLRSAAENAREKAEILCGASGVTLGELVNIRYDWGEINFRSRSAYSDEFRGVVTTSAMPEFEPDDIKSSDTATFVWKIN